VACARLTERDAPLDPGTDTRSLRSARVVLLPPRCDPEVVAVSMTIERDPGDFGIGGGEGGQQQEGEGQISAIRHAASFTRLEIREGKAPMRLEEGNCICIQL
jgi:hypothetical protein